MTEGYTQDYKTYGQYLRKVPAKWWVKWVGVNGRQHENHFISKPDAFQHYNDVARAGFKATTNAQPTKKGGLTKELRASIERIKAAVSTVEGLAPKELKREAQARRKAIVSAHTTMAGHCYKLGIAIPALSLYYSPQQYLDIARIAGEQVTILEQQYNK